MVVGHGRYDREQVEMTIDRFLETSHTKPHLSPHRQKETGSFWGQIRVTMRREHKSRLLQILYSNVVTVS